MNSAAENIMPFPEKSRFRPETAAGFVALRYDAPGWLQDVRTAGFADVKKRGVPTPRLERWKYTNLAPQIKEFGAALSRPDIAYKSVDNFVDNLGHAIDKTPEWLKGFLAGAPPGDDRYGDMMLWHLNDAFLRDGLVIDVPAGKIADKPVEITINGHEGAFCCPRTVIRLGEGAELTLIEYHGGQGRYWHNGVTQILVGANAKLRHYRIQENSTQAVQTQTTQIDILRDGTCEAFTLTTGAGLSRNQMHAVLQGENAHCDLYGLNLLRGRQHGDMTAEVEHRVPHGNSSQLIRSVLDDQAHGVFQGKVYVHKGADKTDGTQLSNALLLAEGAEMDTKPELEIYADDVKCAHGATTGKLEDEALFYLRSRGLPEQQARMLLVEAFAAEVVDKLGDKAVQDTIRNRIDKWLRER